MTPRTQSLLTATILFVCSLAITGWTGPLPSGTGTVALVSLGLVGLALFPHIAPTDDAHDGAADDDSRSEPTSS